MNQGIKEEHRSTVEFMTWSASKPPPPPQLVRVWSIMEALESGLCIGFISCDLLLIRFFNVSEAGIHWEGLGV